MKEMIGQFSSYMPFIGLMVSKHQQSPVITRLIEAGIIGVVIMYGTVQVLTESIDNIRTQLTEVKTEQKDIKDTLIKIQIRQAKNTEE